MLWIDWAEVIMNEIGEESFYDEYDFWSSLHDDGHTPEEALIISSFMIDYEEQ